MSLVIQKSVSGDQARLKPVPSVIEASFRLELLTELHLKKTCFVHMRKNKVKIITLVSKSEIPSV